MSNPEPAPFEDRMLRFLRRLVGVQVPVDFSLGTTGHLLEGSFDFHDYRISILMGLPFSRVAGGKGMSSSPTGSTHGLLHTAYLRLAFLLSHEWAHFTWPFSLPVLRAAREMVQEEAQKISGEIPNGAIHLVLALLNDYPANVIAHGRHGSWWERAYELAYEEALSEPARIPPLFSSFLHAQALTFFRDSRRGMLRDKPEIADTRPVWEGLIRGTLPRRLANRVLGGHALERGNLPCILAQLEHPARVIGRLRPTAREMLKLIQENPEENMTPPSMVCPGKVGEDHRKEVAQERKSAQGTSGNGEDLNPDPARARKLRERFRRHLVSLYPNGSVDPEATMPLYTLRRRLIAPKDLPLASVEEIEFEGTRRIGGRLLFQRGLLPVEIPLRTPDAPFDHFLLLLDTSGSCDAGFRKYLFARGSWRFDEKTLKEYDFEVLAAMSVLESIRGSPVMYALGLFSNGPLQSFPWRSAQDRAGLEAAELFLFTQWQGAGTKLDLPGLEVLIKAGPAEFTTLLVSDGAIANAAQVGAFLNQRAVKQRVIFIRSGSDRKSDLEGHLSPDIQVIPLRRYEDLRGILLSKVKRVGP